MQKIEEKIFSIDVVDIAIVGVSPVRRPDIDQFKTVAAILKLRTALHDHGFGVEGMAVAKMLAELVVRNARALAGGLRMIGGLFRMHLLFRFHLIARFFLVLFLLLFF